MQLQVAVIGKSDGKPICPEHHVMAVPLDNEPEAHYLCAVLMSSPVQLLVAGYTTTTGMSTHVLAAAGDVPPEPTRTASAVRSRELLIDQRK